MLCTTPACFSTFLIYYGPYSSWKYLNFLCIVCYFFLNTTVMIIMLAGLCNCCACSTEAMYHCLYLLHVLVINYLFYYYSLCLVYFSYRFISILYKWAAAPLPLRVATPIWLRLLNVQYSSTPLLLLANPSILHRNNCTTRPIKYIYRKKTLRYQLCSIHYAAVRIKNCLKTTFVATTDDFRNKWTPSRAIDTFDGEQRWINSVIYLFCICFRFLFLSL